MPRYPTDELWKLLPLNATKLERDILRMAPFDAVLQPGVPMINLAKRTAIPASWLPWLIVEYGLGRLQEFIEDPRELIEEGLLFNRQIGTPAAIVQAAGWLDLEAELWEEPEPGLHFAEFQLKLISPPPFYTEILCKLGRAMDIAKPARGRFRRIYNADWNIDRFVLDNSDWGDILDNYSGVWGPDIGLCGGRQLWVSLALRHDLSPENSPMIVGEGLVGDLILAEVVSSSYVGVGDWPIMDDEYVGPPSFGTSGMGSTSVMYEEGYLVDEDGELILDEDDEPIIYLIKNG